MLTDQIQDTIARLKFALSQDRLPQDRVTMAAGLLKVLERSAQISVFGMPGSGKTSLLNMIIGEVAIPDLSEVAVVEVVFGTQALGRFEFDSGDITSFDGIVAQDRVPVDTLHVVQELPLPQLVGKRLVEINFTSQMSSHTELMIWAAEKADIALWCTQGFDDREASLWADMPDGLKDNSFLALTKADRLQMRGLLKDRIAQFQTNYADEFMAMYPIATKQALAAQAKGKIADPRLWQASGGKALMKALDGLVMSAKCADADHAEALLSGLDLSGYEAPRETTAAKTVPAESHQSTGPMDRVEAIDTALSLMQEGADALQEQTQHGTNAKKVLEHCTQTAQALNALFMDCAPSDDALNAFREDALECEQMIQLLQLESSETAAEDAVCVLLQLKKEMAQAVAR